MSKSIIIAIDGHSSTGKSTLAKGLATCLGLLYVDSGAMYRAVTYFALNNNILHNGKVNLDELLRLLPHLSIGFHFNPHTGQSETLLNGENIESHIRSMNVSQHVSVISAIPQVRRFLVEQQQALGKNGGIVMDGRDIGTVVFPKADIKIFMTASEDVRAQRRWLEMKNKGENLSSVKDVKENLMQRDHIDSTRADSPLIQANDAIVLDNSELSLDEQLQWVIELVKRRS